jgi:L-ascorbate metabolism protein UlaG (beta-lactamase superfamily)
MNLGALTRVILVVVGLLAVGLLAVGLRAPLEAAAQERSPAPAPPELVKARQHYFGPENVNAITGRVNPDRVILSWFGTSSLAASLRGRVVLLDTFITLREDRPSYVPTTLAELIALKPEAIFIGHGHFDHADTAGVIASRTGAIIVGTPEHCAQARADAGDPTIRCEAAVSADSPPGAEVNELSTLRPDVCITAFKHLHSAATAPDPAHPLNPVLIVPDLGTLLLHPPGPGPSDGVTTAGNEGFSMFYQFRLDDFALVYHDTVGPLKEQAPHVFDIMRALPPTDVHAGAIVGFNVFTNGLRDPAMYIDALEPKIFVPLHHDFPAAPATSDDWKAAMDRELLTLPAGKRPELRWLYDPSDYLRPGLLTFDIKAPYWTGSSSSTRPAGTCRRTR